MCLHYSISNVELFFCKFNAASSAVKCRFERSLGKCIIKVVVAWEWRIRKLCNVTNSSHESSVHVINFEVATLVCSRLPKMLCRYIKTDNDGQYTAFNNIWQSNCEIKTNQIHHATNYDHIHLKSHAAHDDPVQYQSLHKQHPRHPDESCSVSQTVHSFCRINHHSKLY